MAKSVSSNKVSFGKRGVGKYKKSYGPKSQKPKRYRGQGRQQKNPFLGVFLCPKTFSLSINELRKQGKNNQ